MSIFRKKKLNFKFLKFHDKNNAVNLEEMDINKTKTSEFDNEVTLQSVFCEEIENQLSAYFDDELDNKTKQIIDKHLSTCKSCEIKVSEFKMLSKLINSSQNSLTNSKINSIDFNLVDECEEVNSKLSAYIDSEVSDESKNLIKMHLSKCKACHRDYIQLIEVIDVLNSYFIKTSDYQFANYKKQSTFMNKLSSKMNYTNRSIKIAVLFIIGLLLFSIINANIDYSLLKIKIRQAYQKVYSINFVKN